MSAFLSRTPVALVAVALTITGACSRPVPPVSTSAQELPTLPFDKYVLPNGLEVILSEDHRLPRVAVDVWYHVGPANEAAGRTGFAHLFEHMMFQGSKHVPGDSHFQLLEAAGASGVNGTTSFDRTNYFETLPSNQLSLGLWLESDRMGYLLDTVDQIKLANQQDVVRNERRQNTENTPYGIVQDAVYQQLFPKGHPYHANVIGSHADIQSAKLDDVKQFFRQYYAPNNASLAIVGDFDPKTVRALVEQYFGSLKRGPVVPPVTVETPTIEAERRLVVKDRVELPRVYMAWLTPPFFKPGDTEADAAASALGGNKSSRLYKTLVYDKQIAQDVSAAQYSQALRSVFQITATVRPGHTPEEVEAAITAVVEDFRTHGPDATEVERASNTFETSLLRGLEVLGGFGGVADTLNQFNHYLGDPGYLPKYIREHRDLSPAKVKAFAETYLKPASRVVVYALPGQPDLGPVVPTPRPPTVKPGTGAESVNADEAWRATPPKPVDATPFSMPAPKSFKLANGLTVIYSQRTGLPVAAADLVLRSGGDSNPSTRPGLANFTAAMLDQGTTTRSAPAIADALALLGASLNAQSTKDSISVSVDALTRTFPQALELLADVVMRPAFPAAEIERERASTLARLTQARQDPATVAAMAAVGALFGPSHPYGFVEIGTESSIKALTREELHAFWRAQFVPSNAALVVAGPQSESELRALAEQAFGKWPAGTASAPDLGTPLTTDARVVIIDRPGSAQTHLMVSTIGPARSTPDFPAVNVMNGVLGGLFSSRINLNLREAHGYTYGAFSSFNYRKAPGPFWVSTGVRTDATSPAVTEILKEVRRIRDSVLPAEELTLSKEAIVRALPSDFETSDSTVNTLGALFVYDLGLDFYSTYAAAVQRVTADEARAAARTYLNPDRMIVVAVGDRAKIEGGLKRLGLGTVALVAP